MQDNPNKKEVKFRKLKKFCSYYRPHLPLFLADMFCATVIAGVDLAFPMVSRYALQNLLPNQAYRTFFLIVGALVLAYLLRTAMSYAVSYTHLKPAFSAIALCLKPFSLMMRLAFFAITESYMSTPPFLKIL